MENGLNDISAEETQMDALKSNEKMLTIISHSGNENESSSKSPPHTH